MTTVIIAFISLAMLSFIYAVNNNYQYRRSLIVVIKGHGFKGTTMSSFDSTDTIHQAGEDVAGRETPIMNPTTWLFCKVKGTFKKKLSH